MRLTVNLDPDAYAFAKVYAAGRGITLSAAIGELIRRAEKAAEPKENSTGLKTGPHGYLVIAGTGDAVTSEMVKEVGEDELV